MTMSRRRKFIHRALNLKGENKKLLQKEVEHFRNSLNRMYYDFTKESLDNFIISVQRLKERYPLYYNNRLSGTLVQFENAISRWKLLKDNDQILTHIIKKTQRISNEDELGLLRQEMQTKNKSHEFNSIDAQRLDIIIQRLYDIIQVIRNRKQKIANKQQMDQNEKQKELNIEQFAANKLQLKDNQKQKLDNAAQLENFETIIRVHKVSVDMNNQLLKEDFNLILEMFSRLNPVTKLPAYPAQ